MAKNRNFAKAKAKHQRLREVVSRPMSEPAMEQHVKYALALDKLFTKMKAKKLTQGKATCPSCGVKGALYMKYEGPRSSRAQCTKCNFAMMA